nr:uncharacterized protein LOC124496882 [Dermatophagoides farinae]
MARSQTDIIDIELFQDDFKNIDQKFLQSVVSIFSFFTFKWSFKKQFLLMTENATYAYGDEICSWLSLKHDLTKPQRISCLDDMKIVQVDSGHDFVAILTDDGQVFIASDVDSNWKTKRTLRLISNDNDRFKMIACGWLHLLLLKQDGHVFAMGDNNWGQITGNEISSYEIMIHIDNLENVKFIACGKHHSFSITNKGEIYSWGLNYWHQLGLDDDENRNVSCLVAYPNAYSTRIKDIMTGNYHSLFLFENGQLWGCGSNSLGELGLGNYIKRSTLAKIPIENVKQITCSRDHSFSLAYDGSSYYAWGRTKYGIWSSPKKLNDSHSSFVAASVHVLNSPITFGLTSMIREFGSRDQISYKSIIQLFDNQHSYDVEFIFDKKRIKASKCYLQSVSEYYRLMFSGNWIENGEVPIKNYSYDTYYAYLRMLHTGNIHINRQNITELVDLANCYGDIKLIEYCQTFIRSDLNEQTMTTYLLLITKYEMNELDGKLRNKILAKSPTENIIDIDLFQNDFKKIDQEFLQSVVSIFSFTFDDKKQFLLMTKDATYAYGKQICSWLSLEHDMSKPQRISCLDDMKIIQVDSGWNFVAILTDDGRVYLASNNFYWKMNNTLPLTYSSDYYIIKINWKTNETLRLISNDNDRFKMIACGGGHLLMLRQDGHVFAMGDNSCGQITGNEKSSFESMIHIDKLENVELIVCGRFHSFSITNNGEIYSWGFNDFGQLGLGDEKNRNTPCLVAFPNDDSINIHIKDIVAGMNHSLFLFENGQLWGCGSDNNGEIGLGYHFKRSKLTKIQIKNVKQIACSRNHSFSLAHDGSSYYAWGETKYGIWSSPKKLDGHPTSFASASVHVLDSPITFGLTSIHVFGSHDSISYKSILKLFDNQDSYDVKFIIDKKDIKACKYYLKSVSEYYRRMFSCNWIENGKVPIKNYSYETYYAYLRMLHTGNIYINRQNITELVDLANCYGDIKLIEYCQTFIRSDLNEQTMTTYLSLIYIHEMKKLYDKLVHLAKNCQQYSTKQ